MKLRFYFAFLVAKIIYYGLRLLKKNGTILPGRVALRICPDYLKYVNLPDLIICVSGTNGKTTVSNMIIKVLEDNNYRVLNNKKGANVHAGITSSIIANHGKKDIAVFEVDERSSKRVYKYIKPTYIVYTNIFRDSVKRNANPDYIIGIINSALPKETKLILNADDLLCCRLGEKNKKIYYSIAKQKTDTDKRHNIVNDASICPKCYAKLNYNYIRYNHIGNAYCSNCGFTSPSGNYIVQNIDYKKQNITVSKGKTEKDYHMVSTSIMNIYNELAVISLFSELKLNNINLQESLENCHIVESRYLTETVNGIEIINYLAKGQNPVACSNVLEDIKKQKGTKQVILTTDDVHDNIESSENICWLYDCDYEFLKDKNITKIIIGGPRAKDDYLRLLLAGIDKNKIKYTENPYDTIKYLKEKTDKIFILYDVYSENQALKIKQSIKDKINAGGLK